ncbi:hemerythrin domain-containing protein [Streptomyces sp. NPDC050121]|uniref:hemerythrin domain-containing protein n=1 Tax=Streptomyces sp. NPDC050121 TaxID=3365601 RepID=UPI003791119C
MSDDVLLTHCLAFRAALTSYRQGEDDGTFSELLRQRPDPAATVTNLVQDHGLTSSTLSQAGELADRAAESRDPAPEATGREHDGLTAITESRFSYEERTISEALDEGIPDTDWSDKVFGFGMA